MKKICLIIILMLFPVITKATCNNTLREEGKTLSANITSEIKYSSSKNTFTLHLYNVDDNMSVVYLKKTYKPTNGEISISNISEGKSVTLDIYYIDGCDGQIDIIKKTMPYYNRYYGSLMCDGYEDKLYTCSTQFTSYYVSEEIVKLSIRNYETKRIPIEHDTELPKEEKPTVLEKAKEIVNKWGVRIALLIGSSLITIIIGNNKYRKEVHGV